jgi:hypothetical protein
MEKSLFSWNVLHDAVLISLRFEWEEALASILVRAAHANLELAVRGVVLIECSRKLPWGRSACILSARVVDSEDGALKKLELEMQSGDLIKVAGTSVTLEEKT